MLSAVIRAAHPGPAAAVTVITVLLGIAVGLEPWRVAVLGLAMAFDQLSVGLSNDWIDAERDRAAGRTDKPIVRGEIGIPVVRVIAIAAAIAALVVTVPLGWPAVVMHVVMLGSAWGYNAGLKRSAWSVAPYVVSFGLLPAFVTLALPSPVLPAWWAVAAGALLGTAAHFANVLPDLDDDRRTGVRGLPHRLPRAAVPAIAWTALLAAAVLLALGIGIATPLAIAGLVAACAVAGVAIAARRAPRWGFRLVLAAALVDVLLLVLAGAGITSR